MLTFAATFGAGVTTGETWAVVVEDVDAGAAVGAAVDFALLTVGATAGALVVAGAAELTGAVAGGVGELQAATKAALDTATRPARQRRRLTRGANKERGVFPSVCMRPFYSFHHDTGRV